MTGGQGTKREEWGIKYGEISKGIDFGKLYVYLNIAVIITKLMDTTFKHLVYYTNNTQIDLITSALR